MFKYFENLSDIKKIVASWCVGWYYVCGVVLLDVSPFWLYFLKGCGTVIFGTIGVFAGLLITDFYKEKLKHKIFKSKQHGTIKKEEDTQANNERVA